MEGLLDDVAFATAVIAQANLSGLAFGFFAALFAMTVGMELRIKNPSVIAKRPYLVRRGILIYLYVLAMFFSSAFVGLTLPTAKFAQFSLSGTALTFVACVAMFLLVDTLVQSFKSRPRIFIMLFTLVGNPTQFLIHAAFIFIPNNFLVLEVRWSGLFLTYLFVLLCMFLLSRFAQETSIGQPKPIQSRMIYILGIVGVNQLISLAMIGFVHVVRGEQYTDPYGLWTGWAQYEVTVSFFALVMISMLLCYVYILLDKSFQVLRIDNQKLQLTEKNALAMAANASERLAVERTHNEQLERSIKLVQRDHEMSVDSLVTAVSTLEEGVFEWDIEHESMVFSLTWRRLFGLDENTRESIDANTWRKGVLSEDMKQLDSALQTCLTPNPRSTSVQVRYATQFGSVLKLEIQLAAVKNAYGLPSKVVGIIRDRTEEMDLELSIREELSEESLLSSRKSQFVSYLSHEIRTPMTVISSAKALLESTLKSKPSNTDAAMSYVEQIGGALRSLRELVDETLMFMGANFTRNRLNIEQLDVRQLFEQFYSIEQMRRHGKHWLSYELHNNLEQCDFYSDEVVFTQALRQMLAYAESKDSQAGKFSISMTERCSLNLCIELLEWPAWMLKSGQLEPLQREETAVPFKGECLPFTILLTKRVIRIINGRVMIKSHNGRHWLCVDLPSMKEQTCRVS